MKRWMHANNNILDTWFIVSDDGADNCCIQVEGYDKPMRGRSAMICLKEVDGELYIISKHNEDDYGVPGGGWDRGEDPKDAAIRELHEEVKADVKNVKRLGTLIEYHDTVKDWVKEHVKNPDDWWYGYYSVIFVGEYAGKFTGFVSEDDEERGYHWIEVRDIKHKLPKEYVKAIEEYTKEKF